MGWTWLERLRQDIRFGFRTLRKNPLFAAMAVLSLALGIGANTAIYSVMDAIMLRALPVRNPGELAILNWRAKREPEIAQSQQGETYDEPGGGKASQDFPWPSYELPRNHNDVFSTLFAYKDAGQLNLVVHGQAGIGPVELISGNFFSGLGIVPAAGRLIDDSDNRGGTTRVAVLSYASSPRDFINSCSRRRRRTSVRIFRRFGLRKAAPASIHCAAIIPNRSSS